MKSLRTASTVFYSLAAAWTLCVMLSAVMSMNRISGALPDPTSGDAAPEFLGKAAAYAATPIIHFFLWAMPFALLITLGIVFGNRAKKAENPATNLYR